MATNTSTFIVELNTTYNLPIKLNSTNYSTRYEHINLLLVANNVLGYLDGTSKCPLATLGSCAIAPTILPFFNGNEKPTMSFLLFLAPTDLKLKLSCLPQPPLMMPSCDYPRHMPSSPAPKSCYSKNVLPPFTKDTLLLLTICFHPFDC